MKSDRFECSEKNKSIGQEKRNNLDLFFFSFFFHRPILFRPWPTLIGRERREVQTKIDKSRTTVTGVYLHTVDSARYHVLRSMCFCHSNRQSGAKGETRKQST